MLNIVVMQWGIIKCCKVIGFGDCIESTAGILQLSLQWFLFTVVFVLYMVYFPPHRKFVTGEIDLGSDLPPQRFKTAIKSDDWKESIYLSWVALIHLLCTTFVTLYLLTSPSPDTARRSKQISAWAAFLGVSAAVLASLQYAPQIVHTYRTKLVGALSIKMMLIQTPGALFMVTSIILRPGTNWTTWLSYAVAGAMQGTLLVMCIIWHARQRRHGIDDFGNPLDRDALSQDHSNVAVIRGPEEGFAVPEAVGVAVDSDVREEFGIDVIATQDLNDEDTPLLSRKDKAQNEQSGWFRWLTRPSR